MALARIPGFPHHKWTPFEAGWHCCLCDTLPSTQLGIFLQWHADHPNSGASKRIPKTLVTSCPNADSRSPLRAPDFGRATAISHDLEDHQQRRAFPVGSKRHVPHT